MAESRVFYYETQIEWRKEKEGEIKGPGLSPVAVGAPPEFSGREGNWAPDGLTSAHDLGRVPRILDKAKENCFISNSVKSVIKLEPEVHHHQTQASPSPLGEAPESVNPSSDPKRR